MEQFSFENLDITRASNETIAELGEVLWHFTSVHCKEDLAIAEKYRETISSAWG